MQLIVVVFFFKQKTAYEMLRSLVGSEMCIRDRNCSGISPATRSNAALSSSSLKTVPDGDCLLRNGCLLYTSDAADDLLCVDLGGRRIIKKKKLVTKVSFTLIHQQYDNHLHALSLFNSSLASIQH